MGLEVMDFLPISFDWLMSFRPAALAMLHGSSPYNGFGFYNPPWMLLPFIPFALMPEAVGKFCILVISLLAFAYIAYRFDRNPVVIGLFLLSSPVIGSLNTGGLDWFSMLAFVLPAQFGLIFATLKPQIGLGISLYWLIQSWRTGGIREVIKNFLPVSILLIGSVFLYGPWFIGVNELSNVEWNVSIFPYGIPIGFLLLGLAFIKREIAPAIPAGLFFAPYYSGSNLAVLLIPLFKNPKLLVIAWLCFWVFTLLRT
jgi:hypothetical protein